MSQRILGLGNALVDTLVQLSSEQLLHELQLPKGSMQLVDSVRSKQIENQIASYPKTMASGGSAANTIHGLARLGIETAFIGQTGPDELGRFFRNDMESSKIKPVMLSSDQPTGHAIALVTPDGERTFATFLGAAAALTAQDLRPEFFHGYYIFHIEGYLVQNHKLILRSVELAKNAGLKISLDLASYNVVETNLEFLQNLTKKSVDILFANEEEARSFTGKEPREALDELSKYCEIVVVKTGSKGSLVKKGNEVHTIAGQKVNCIDTTGAGDLYASGFLYGLVKGLHPEKCGQAGTILASRVIQTIGAKVPEKEWEIIVKEIHELSH